MFLPLPHVLKKQSSQSYKQDSKQQCRGVRHKEVPSQMGLYKPFAAMSTFVMRPLSNLGSKSLTWSNSEGNSKISINVSNIDETHVFCCSHNSIFSANYLATNYSKILH